MTSAWVRAQDRKRGLVAAASTVCLYAAIFLAAWLLGLIAPVSLASVPSTVIVDLGNGEGPAGQVPLGLAGAPDRPEGTPPGAAPLPAAGSGEQSASASSEPPAKAEAAPKPSSNSSSATLPASVKAAKAVPQKASAKVLPAKASSKAIPEKSSKALQEEAAASAVTKAAQAEAKARAAEEEAAVRAAAATAQASAAPAKTKTFGSSSGAGQGGAPVTGSGTGTAPGVAGGTGSVTFRGSEMGNALATTFGASTGQVGRNIYVPIYLYMPLPQSIPDSIYRNVAAKETFRSYYRQSGSDWQLVAQPQVSQRGDVWTMLENAGYDASKADFKAGRKLSPVVLEFAVGPVSKSRVELVDVRLVSSSGSSEIDEAVMYGFRQASFFNKTGFAVGGKFVYGF